MRVKQRVSSRRAAPLLLLALLAAAAAQPLAVIPSLSSSGDALRVDLTVVAARLSSGSAFSLSTRAYTWRSGSTTGGPALSGPTLRVLPGDTLTIALSNSLGADFGPDANWAMNEFWKLNTTNMHTHGLHVSPDQDDVFTSVPPGGAYEYVYTIPDAHAPGLHWYHAHAHGATTVQVMGGLLGAIVVDAPAGLLPAWLAALPEYVCVLQYFNFVAQNLTTSSAQGHPSQSFASIEALAYNTSGGFPAAYSASATYTNTEYYTVNGAVSPTLTMVAGSSTVLRIVYAAVNNFPTLALSGGVASSCSLQVIAMDGVYLTAPRAQAFVRLSAGTRADIVVGCAQPGAVNLSTSVTPYSWLAQTVIALNITGAPAAPAPLPATIAIVRPPYLADMMNVVPVTNAQLSIQQPAQTPTSAQGNMFWLGLGSNCSAVNAGTVSVASNTSNCAFAPFAGSRGTAAAAYPAGAVQILGQPAQAVIYGAGQAVHPMHIHVNHFQVIAVPSGYAADNWTYAGDWRDTIVVGVGRQTTTPDSGAVIRWWPYLFTGEVIVHCHILHHEDTGMMTSMLIASPAPGTAAALTSTQQLGLGLGIALPLAAAVVLALLCAQRMALESAAAAAAHKSAAAAAGVARLGVAAAATTSTQRLV
jgi:FtsP/CotA-like multicopper oxidase with cupredoxin domain